MFSTEGLSQFKAQFIDRLRQMLDSDHLGAFILVLANSQQDSETSTALKADIATAYERLKGRLDDISATAPADDVDVFKQLLDTELSDLPLWKSRQEGCWHVTCNTTRRLRPARASSEILGSIRKGFDPSTFNFNKPFLKPEILWQGKYSSTQLRVLYNKFPFADYHVLIAVAPEEKRPQVIDEESHHLVYHLVSDNADRFPGFGVGFNSLAAGASVNHLHFQGFFRQARLPIENTCWNHNGGEQDYPLTVYRFDTAECAWDKLGQLVERDIAFNCLYRESGCYVIPRRYQGTVELPEWLQGAGWLDVAGVMTVSDDESLNCLQAKKISDGLGLLAVAV